MDERFSKNRVKVWLAWLVISLFLAYQYALRVLPNIIMPYLQENFHITASNFGQFSGLYYVGYTLAHIPLGVLLDYVGLRTVVSLSIASIVVGLLPLVYSDSWFLTSSGRILVGIASSAAILGSFKVIRMGFPSRNFPFMLGLTVTIGFIGASYGGQLVDYCARLTNMQVALKGLVIIGLILLILSFMSFSGTCLQQKFNIMDIKSVFSRKKWMLIAALGGLMVGPIEGFADGWATTFLKVTYPHLDIYLFSFLPSLILLGLAIGAPILGFIAEKTEAYYKLIITSGFVMLTCFLLLLLQFQSVLLLLIIFFLIGAFSSYQTLIIHKAATLVDEKFVGLTTACANMVIMIFGYFFHTAIGEIIQKKSVGYSYTYESLMSGISIIPICLLIASCAFIYISIRDKSK